MTDAQNPNPNTPSPQDSDNAGGEKLIFGKYKTIEEAEKAHKELERHYHEDRTEISRLGEAVEGLVQLEQSRTVNPDATPVNQEPNMSARVLTEFYQNPIGVLTNIKDIAKKEIREELTKEQQASQQNAATVSKWASNNPDVVAHGDLLAFYVSQTDAKLSPDKRLDKAAEIVRKRIIELRQGKSLSSPAPGDHVDAPGGSGGEGDRSPNSSNLTPADPEASLKAYVASRNKSVRRPLGMKRASS